MPQIPHCVLLITSSCCALLKIPAVTWRLPYKTAFGSRFAVAGCVKQPFHLRAFSYVPSGSFLPPAAPKSVRRCRCMLSKQDVSNLSDGPHLWRFATQLSEQGYAHKTTVRYIAVAKRFLAYLHQRNVAVEVAKPADVE